MQGDQARLLRRNATNAERRMWRVLRDRRLSGIKFRRQHEVIGFVVDFACVERRLVVEIDGGQHAESNADERRTALLTVAGWRVIRFWNNDVLATTPGVLQRILEEVERG